MTDVLVIGAGIAVADLGRLFPKADPRRALLDYRVIDWGRDRYSCGGYTFLRPGGTGARGRLAAADTGALFWAGSATESTPIAATVEAAYLSGLRAAAEVRALLHRDHGKGVGEVGHPLQRAQDMLRR
jgi:monoamine oxidase